MKKWKATSENGLIHYIYDQDGLLIAELHSYSDILSPDVKEQRANAKLIAKAPEMKKELDLIKKGVGAKVKEYEFCNFEIKGTNCKCPECNKIIIPDDYCSKCGVRTYWKY